MAKLKLDGTLVSPMKGMAYQVNELGYLCIYWHYSADPVKDDDWVREQSAGIVGGVDSEDWQQEQEMNHHVVQGRLTYYAFNRKRNVIDVLPVSIEDFRRWQHSLSFDYGATNPTSVLFHAEHPTTGDIVTYDEIYVHTSGSRAWPEDQRTAGAIASRVYDKVRLWFGVSPDEPLDFSRHVAYAVGDPAGKGAALEYATCAYPIAIGHGAEGATVKLNDVDAGERRVNSFLAPAFLCCPDEQGVKKPIFAERAECPKCGKIRLGRPRATILGKNCPELVRQLSTLRKKVATRPELEDPTKNTGAPDHSADSYRYAMMARSPEAIKSEQTPAEEEKAGPETVLQRHMRHLFERAEMERKVQEMGDFDPDAYGDPLVEIDRRYALLAHGPMAVEPDDLM